VLNQRCKKHILIVDDDDILPFFLQKYLLQHDYTVTCILDGEAIPATLDKETVDIIVLDILLPKKDGFYWLNWLRHYHPQLSVIIASVKTGENDRLKGLEAGAQDYLVKPFHYKELLLRLENILQKKRSNRNMHQIIYIGNLRFDTTNNKIYKGDVVTRLTQMEANILQLLYLNAGRVLSRDEIMETIKGIKHTPLDRSIDIHINKIRKKVEEAPLNPVFIHTVRGKGYVLQLPEISLI
jgi:DNA-binding response OmpR family regulator